MKRKLVYDDCDSDVKKTRTHEKSSVCGLSYGFDPVYFFRCHSKKNDAADIQTQIWQCAFEPSSTKKLVATCGGNSVCFINVQSGEVEGKYYSDNIGDIFYTLSWTTVSDLKNDENIVAVGGNSKYIHLLHPKEGILFFKYHLPYAQSSRFTAKRSVCSLLFHNYEKNLLFCGQSNGNMTVFDIGCPLPPYYRTKFCKLYMLSAETEIFTLAFCSVTDVLLAACNDGLRGWKIRPEEKMEKASLLKFKHPTSRNTSYRGEQLVDSVEVLGKSLVASKCALHGNIYVWNLEKTLKGNNEKYLFNISPCQILNWRDTDNYFMYMGHNEDSSILACGDDKGALWIYNTRPFLTDSGTKGEKVVEPVTVLPWPEVEDVYLDSKRKLRLDVYDIVIDKVSVDCSGKYIVAVTSNNMVCVWKRSRN